MPTREISFPRKLLLDNIEKFKSSDGKMLIRFIRKFEIARPEHKKFDDIWRISETDTSTYDAFLDNLGNSSLAVVHKTRLCLLAKDYRSVESKRWNAKKDKLDVYHTHGLFSAYYALRAIELAGDKLNENEKFLVIAATLLHDAGGSQDKDEKVASAKIELVQKLLKASNFSDTEIPRIENLISFTNYSKENNPARIEQDGLSAIFKNENIPLAENIVIACDLAQIGAKDYWERALVAGYGDKMPNWLNILATEAEKNLLEKLKNKLEVPSSQFLGRSTANLFHNALLKIAPLK